MVQPTLTKPKSKIRLRLGLTPPNPKSTAKATASTTTNSHAVHLSPPENDNGLASSTSTSASGMSRPDSRSAFTYDSFTPSPNSQRPEFDTISYNTISPESVAYAGLNASEYGRSNGRVEPPSPSHPTHPTRATSSLSLREAYGDDAYDAYEHTDAMESTSTLPTPRHYGDEQYDQEVDDHPYPAIQSVTAGTDDIFSLTDQQLSDRFEFVNEIGYGNWGSVWLCKPKHYKKYMWNHQTYDREATKAILRLGKRAAASGGSGACGQVAITLVHRSRTHTTAARVRALWGEMKIIRSLKHEPHPSIIQFEAFVITPTMALVIMPHMSHLMPVCLPPYVAIPYLRQLASAVAYLHERGITHNDIKPANVLLSHNDIPVLVDFGFAQQWDVNARGSFLSSISWGTPEYLDPQRAYGMPHDERASDVWSLGITMFEILVGRTPFEANDEEEFQTPEQLLVYYDRTRRGEWVGDWAVPADLEDLLRRMIYPDPTYRISAIQAYHHPALVPTAPSVIITPHFVRAAATFDGEWQEPVPQPSEYTQAIAAMNKAQKQNDATADSGKNVVEKKKKRKTKKDPKERDGTRHSQRATTPALGESIKQHTSVSKPKRAKGTGDDKENDDADERDRALHKLVIKRREIEERGDNDEDDPTPTKMLKPAQPLRIKELSLIADKKVVPRTSNSQLANLSRPNSAASNTTATESGAVLSHATSTSTLKAKRASVLSSGSAPKSKEEAVLKTMRSLEGTRKLIHTNSHANLQAHAQAQKEKASEALAAVKRAAPEPPRPKSLDSSVTRDSKGKKDEERRSLGLDRAVLVEVKEEEIDIKVKEGNNEIDTAIHFHEHPVHQSNKHAEPMSPPRAQRSSAHQQPTPSPQKHRRGKRPQAELDSLRNKVLPASDDESPLAELREKIVVADHEKALDYRRVSGEMETFVASPDRVAQPQIDFSHRASASIGKDRSNVVEKRSSLCISEAELSPSLTGTLTGAIPRTKSVEALAMDSHLDKMSTWIKSVESIIQDARKAIAEGREPPLPVLTLPQEITGEAQEHRFGVTPDKASAIPSHLRTSSTQVEPSTPPKWMTMAEAEEKIKVANKLMEEQGKKGKKERPTVSHVLKLFGADKAPASGSRSNTPEPGYLVPLKPPAASHVLRGAPSTPTLRSSTTRGLTRVPMRKSESNLRKFNTMPTIPSPSFIAGPEYDEVDEVDQVDGHAALNSPRRVRYENLLTTEPGVVRQGDGWSSLSSGKGMMKPSSSMASLRERARALLGDSHATKAADKERHITDLSKSTQAHGHKLEKRSSRLTLNDRERDSQSHPQTARPGTPAAQSVMTMKTDGGKKGWLKSLKGAMGRGKKAE